MEAYSHPQPARSHRECLDGLYVEGQRQAALAEDRRAGLASAVADADLVHDVRVAVHRQGAENAADGMLQATGQPSAIGAGCHTADWRDKRAPSPFIIRL